MDNINEIVCQLTDLVIKSESRIDRTNDMICKLSSLLDKLSNEYIIQINKLQEARDNLSKQNTELLSLLKSAQHDIEMKDKKYDQLIDKIFTTIQKNSSENNINIK